MVLAAGVVAWDVWCVPGETLSEGVDRWLEHHPWLTRVVAALVVGHVVNLIPARADPIHLAYLRIAVGIKKAPLR